jgi:hypothetical protein
MKIAKYTQKLCPLISIELDREINIKSNDITKCDT